MKKIIVVFGLLLVFSTYLFTSLFKGSYANIVDNKINMDLYDNSNKEILLEDMTNFIDLVDDYIFINSSFNISDKLNENYDFLTNFVMSFISSNQEFFEIKHLEYILSDDISYSNKKNNSNKYIDSRDFYNVTYKIFGIDYYYITDDNLIIDDNLILLVENNDVEFNMKIDKINNIYKGNNYYDVFVKYVDNDINYVYRFDLIDGNRLVISNLSVGE